MHSAAIWIQLRCDRRENVFTPTPADKAEQPLVEALTNRELDVRELLVKRLQDKEIADELGISVETVKTHVKRIRGKLGVSSCQQAATKARELGLIQDRGKGPQETLRGLISSSGLEVSPTMAGH